MSSALDMFGDENDDWMLQEDNDPKHTLKKCENWRDENGVTRIRWPSQSPDLNPMENLWANMKINVMKRHPKNLQELQNMVDEEWSKFGPELAQHLVESMPRRIQAIIAVDGDYIMY